jgi:hypothetical protein
MNSEREREREHDSLLYYNLHRGNPAGDFFDELMYVGRKIMVLGRQHRGELVVTEMGTIDSVRHGSDGEMNISVKMDSDAFVFDEITLMLS